MIVYVTNKPTLTLDLDVDVFGLGGIDLYTAAELLLLLVIAVVVDFCCCCCKQVQELATANAYGDTVP